MRSELEEARRQADRLSTMEKTNQDLQQKLTKLEKSVRSLGFELCSFQLMDEYHML